MYIRWLIFSYDLLSLYPAIIIIIIINMKSYNTMIIIKLI